MISLHSDEAPSTPFDTFNGILASAVTMHASDVYIRPTPKGARVQFRVDGRVQDRPLIARDHGNGVVRCAKMFARLDIAKEHCAQDGTCRQVIQNTTYYFRVTSQPAKHGEEISIRIQKGAGASSPNGKR